MSAWLVEKEHIDVLVTAHLALEPGDHLDPKRASIIGDRLWQENVRSLRYRYEHADEDWDLPEEGSYSFEPRPVEDLYYVLKQLHCYDYQACEHPDYSLSWSSAFVDVLQGQIEERLGQSNEDLCEEPAYNIATWGVYLKEDGTPWLDANAFYAWIDEHQEIGS